ncbi:IucA/IucC family protein [Paenibacillus tundrae]
MSTVMKLSSLQAAEHQIMEDLINAFLAEGLLPLPGNTLIELSAAPEKIRRMKEPYQYGQRAGWQKDQTVGRQERTLENKRMFAQEGALERHGTLDERRALNDEQPLRETGNRLSHAGLQSEDARSTGAGQVPKFLVHLEGIVFMVQSSIRQGKQWVQGSPVYTQNAEGKWIMLSTPVAVGHAVLRLALSDEAYAHPGVAEFVDSIETATEQLALGLEQVEQLNNVKPSNAYEWFIKGERIAALRDRPFHPTSKAKIGFTEKDVRRYAAEFGEKIPLRWVAVRKDVVQQGCEDNKELSTLDILDEPQQKMVEEAFQRNGINLKTYMPMPVHPWQLEHIILPRYAAEFKDRTILVLDVEVGEVQATSSLRSMSSVTPSTYMLKLPVSVLSLGAARYLPVVKLLNGLAGERMLRQAVACDDSLAGKVFLCQEQNWWGYMPETMGLFDDHPRHLAAQIRIYPPELLQEGVKVIPMAALGVPLDGRHLLSELLGEELSKEDVIAFYTKLAGLFYDVVMRLFKVGVVPEIHGQNCCVVLRHQQVKGLLFRDHDSVRLHQPYLDKHGIADPAYWIRPGYSNSLYNETIEKLIFYVQSLGTQVNLAAIIDALVAVYDLPEAKLWDITEQMWKEALHRVQLPEADRAELFRLIFQRQEWPAKLVVRPLLEADGVPGAMPSGKGAGHNPFYIG